MTDPWRDRARRAVGSSRLLRPTGDVRPHYVVCGQDALAYHVVIALLAADLPTGPPRITVVVPYRPRGDGPEIRKLPGIKWIEADRLDERTLRRAGLAGATGLALLHQDDVGNIHAALCAQAVEPRLRIVLRMFNTGLANGVRRLLPDTTVLSDAAMAAPAFVAAALGEVDPTHFRHGGRTLHVARRADVPAEAVVCGLADTSDPGRLRVLPADADRADVVLAEANGQPVGTEVAARRIARDRRRRRPARLAVRAARSFVTRKIGIATLTVLATVLVLGVALAYSRHDNLGNGLYITIVTTISGSDPEPDQPILAKIMQVVLTIGGLALVPLITAAVVDGIVNARLALATDRLQPYREDHMVVLGLGNVGTRVMAQLQDLGVEVVAIDADRDARGAPLARRLNIPLIVGDGGAEEVLATASIGTARALLVLTTDDVTNLQAALHARAAREDLLVVLRLFDGDFADRIQRAFNINISRSVSYLAAPAFAAALLNRAVIATIPVHRHVLLVAEVPVAAGSALVGRPLRAAQRPEAVRVIAVQRSDADQPDWAPAADTPLAVGDRLTAVVRRAGLSWLLKQASAGHDGAAVAARSAGPADPGGAAGTEGAAADPGAAGAAGAAGIDVAGASDEPGAGTADAGPRPPRQHPGTPAADRSPATPQPDPPSGTPGSAEPV
ncbi:NAD-binding protein [Plantactinospora sp. KBS50]|uniref:potassium channel protein n=1 Tax=Plantactinospora sp. KBS50 TaxID=2024580 RepID=UPI000BAB03A4|nr:NAD-binding protein [Plantactinospora sp. KBS50]ASW56976.1 potassium transporter TrkA [Plantactinospora sp. KBS50]